MNFNNFFSKTTLDIPNRFRMFFSADFTYRQHILDTYFSTRAGIAIIGLLFPLILWFGGLILDIKLQSSISAYYHTPMRNVFVGILFAIGTFLYLYKGYGTVEDLVLDGAGICAIGIALLPTSCPNEAQCDVFTAPVWHGVSAISFFILIAGVCIAEGFGKFFRSKIQRSRLLSAIYFILGIAMIVLPFLVWIFYRDTGILVFKLEFAAVWVFSTYWIVKSLEIYLSALETPEKFFK